VLDALWTRLATGAVIRRPLKGRRLDEPADIWVDELEAVLRVAQIKPSVVGMMDSYAHDARHPRSYMEVQVGFSGHPWP
jgi:hypothetical protein